MRQNSDGRGPAWSNSLFEDNAEFGMGMRVALDQRLDAAIHLLRDMRPVDRRRAERQHSLCGPDYGSGHRGTQRVIVEDLKQRLGELLDSDAGDVTPFHSRSTELAEHG